MRGVYLLVVLVPGLAGCWGASSPGPAKPDPAKGLLAISQNAFGPLDGKTPGTLAAMRQAFVGFDVKPINDEGTLEYRVFKGDELLLYVVPDDDGTIFNVHATSGKVSVTDRDWRVGAPFQGAAQLTQCECWGENPTCWKQGEHVAVNFARECGDLAGADQRMMRVLDGITVQRIVWSPKPFGTAVHHEQGEIPDEDRD
jgi:hypothetical protein